MLRREQVRRLLQEDLGEAKDGVQRGPELVGHVRQELRLVPGGGLELLVGGFQVPRALRNSLLQLVRVCLHLFVESGVFKGDRRVIREAHEKGEVLLGEKSPRLRCMSVEHAEESPLVQEGNRHVGHELGNSGTRCGKA